MAIPITYLRSSGYGSHEMCDMKYFGEYILGINGPSGLAADKGTIAHKVLESFALWKKATQEGEDSFYDEGLGITIDANTTPDTLTSKVFDYYSQAFSHHNWCKKDYDFCLDSVMKVLGTHLDPRTLTVVDAEPYFDIEFTEPWARYDYEVDGKRITGNFAIKGTIDLIIKVTDDTYEICDWKTGKRINWATGEEYTYEKLFSNHQLRMYHYAAHMLYPTIKNIIVTIDYINDGGPFTIPFTRADIPDTIDMIQSKFLKIQKTSILRPSRSWKCKAFCYFGKSTFADTNVKPLTEHRGGQVCSMGDKMTKCEQLKYCLKHRSMDSIITHMSAPGHELDTYQAPGATDK